MLGDGLSTFVNKGLRAGAYVSVGLKPTDAEPDRDNFVNNPKPSTFSGTNTLWYVSARGAGAASTSAIADGYWVDTVTSASASASYTWNVGSLSDPTNQGIEVLAGETFTASVYVTSSIADSRSFTIKWYNSAGSLISSSSAATITLPANTEVRAEIYGVAPALATYASMDLNTNGSSVIRTVGSTLKMRKALMESGVTAARAYFDGDTPVDFRYGAYWQSGFADESPSTLVFQKPTLFTGRIKSVDTVYPLEGPAQVTINASDVLEDFLAFNVPTWDIPAAMGGSAPFDPIETLQVAFDVFTNYVNADDSWQGVLDYPGSVPFSANMQDLSDPVVLGSDDVSMSNIVNSCLDCELGMITIDYDNDFDGTFFSSHIIFYPRNTVYGTVDAIPTFFRRNYYSVGNINSPDAVINDIQLYSTTNELANKVVATLAWDSAVKVTDKNQDSIDLYGELSTERSLNLWNLFALTTWAKALNEYMPVNYARSVAGISATPGKPIAAFAFMKPSDLLTLQFAHNDLTLNESYRIVNVNHSISVDEWNTTVELWKGN